MNLTRDELKIALECLKYSTDTYEELGLTIQVSPTVHLCYLKEKALIRKIELNL